MNFFTKNIKVAPEGVYIILSSSIILISLSIFLIYISFYWLAATSLILFALICYFFRDPSRPTIDDNNVFLSPVDGKVISITNVNDPEIGESKKIAIFLSVFDVHRQWVPLDGKVVNTFYNPGKFFGAYKNKSSLKNEQTSIIFNDSKSNSFKIKQIAGFIARRIVNHMKPDLQVEQGQKLGFIKFGSRVDLFLPKNIKIKTDLNCKVIGGETIIAEY